MILLLVVRLLTHGAIAIALLSLLSATVNGILVCLGISGTALNFFVEVGVLVADLIAIVALFYGVIYRRPAFLKPYLFVNILWNLVLLLLFFLCIAQLIKDEEMSHNIMWNVLEISNYRPRRSQIKTVATLATTVMIGGLLVTILVNFWFLYIVFLCFQWMNAYGVKITDSARPTPDDTPFAVKQINESIPESPKASETPFDISNIGVAL
ncbi:unnamed protein product [Toxocara canis]|uniref:Uncharacterized protein n=1 Tax=Toxocara canis TaxID=6265 RepID=A0A183TWJ6_TOXCA|nr:unnamed protein product [Toxocara canis]